MKGIFALLFSLFCVLNHTALFSQKADAFKWLVGNWKINTSNGQIVESWTILNDSTLLGRSVFVKNPQDSVIQETLELSFRKGAWSYSSTVQGQNNNQAVAFKMIYQRGTEFICVNPEHDFPQRIAYLRLSASQMLASIEGTRKGRFSKQNFNFTQ